MLASLKQYTKEQIITEQKNRMAKIASLLDDSDYEDMLQQALTWLDQVIFNPRAVIIEPQNIISYKGGWFVDVTALKVDTINNVYYQETFEDNLNTILPEVGLMPFICGYQTFTSISSVAEYLQIKGNLNAINRDLRMNGDYELFPKESDGRQLLQVRNNNMIRMEFLPSIDRDDGSWYLYDFEYSSVKDLLFAMLNKLNAQIQFSASSLGVGKDAKNLIDYWDSEIEKVKKEFQDKVLITYIA